MLTVSALPAAGCVVALTFLGILRGMCGLKRGKRPPSVNVYGVSLSHTRCVCRRNKLTTGLALPGLPEATLNVHYTLEFTRRGARQEALTAVACRFNATQGVSCENALRSAEKETRAPDFEV